MKIRTKLLSGFIILVVLGLLLGTVGIISVKNISTLSSEQQVLQSNSQEISSILTAHYSWRQAITETVFTYKEFTGSLDPTACALGKWRNEKESSVTDDIIMTLLKDVDEPHNFIHNEAADIVELLKWEDQEKSIDKLMNEIMPNANKTITIITDMLSRYTELLNEQTNKIASTQQSSFVIIIVTIILMLIISIVLSIQLLRSIMNPIIAITNASNSMAMGDLDITLDYKINDEIGQLVNSFHTLVNNTKEHAEVAKSIADGDLTVSIVPKSNKDTLSISMQRMINNLSDMFINISGASDEVSNDAKLIADGSQVLAQGSTEQASAIEQLEASVKDILDKTKKNAHMAKEAELLSNTIISDAQKGSVQMEQLMIAVQEINEASTSINKVIKVIDDIAFQTNILALNAAVEAARAGQHGKGFAVVAEEVRNLASKSAEAAKDTGNLILNSIDKAELGYKIATETSESLHGIVDGISKSNNLVIEIAESSNNQASSISEINTGITQVAQVVQQNSATAQQSAAASEELNSQAIIMNDFVSQFKLNESKSNKRTYHKTEKKERTYDTPLSITDDSFGKY